MSLLVLHGEDIVRSRRRLIEVVSSTRQKGWGVTQIDGSKASKSDLLAAGRLEGLLSRNELVVVEGYIVSHRDALDVLQELAQVSGSYYVFWEKKGLSPAKVAKLKKIPVKIEEFKVPHEVFKFLDSLVPGNTRSSLGLLKGVLEKDSGEFLLFMIARQIRLLLWAKLDPGSLKVAPWQRSRLAHQAERWQESQLRQFHTKLLELDRASKSSRLPEDLSSSLEVLVASY